MAETRAMTIMHTAAPGDLHLASLALDPPVRVSRSATLREAAALMQDRQSSCLLVGTGPAELVTDHDLVSGLAAGMGPDAPVGEVASLAPVWATTTTTLADAVRMMVRHHVRHLLVIEADGRPQGFLSLPTAIETLLRSGSRPWPES